MWGRQEPHRLLAARVGAQAKGMPKCGHTSADIQSVCSENTKVREIGEVLDLQTAAGCSGLRDCCRLPRFAWKRRIYAAQAKQPGFPRRRA
jgi:hypothetical protein